MKNLSILLVFSALFMFSCENEKKADGTAKKDSESIMNLPPLPEEARMELYRKTIAIDIIAYELGISMSYNDPGSVKPVLAMVKPDQGSYKKKCKPVGRITFMFDTGIGQEADMLIHNGCKTFIWLKDGKYAYMNDLTDEGLQFFTQYMPEDPSKLKIPENAQPVKKGE